MQKNTVTVVLIVIMLLSIGTMLTATTSAATEEDIEIDRSSLLPSTLTTTLSPGESISETKTVSLSGVMPMGDIIFAFDLTFSMDDEIDVVKDKAIDIMISLDSAISNAQYGVVSFMDYPHTYSSYGYSDTYGSDEYGDYAYRLDLPITGDRAQISAAIASLEIGAGIDPPQDYARIMYESYADPALGWRTGSKHLLVIFGDALPHDDNLNQDVPGKSGTLSFGGDPGRDEVMFSADDLDLQTVLTNMASSKVTLLYVQGSPVYEDAIDYWNYWTGLTGGSAYALSEAAEIPEAIVELVGTEVGHIDALTLVAEVEYGAWLTGISPAEYTDIDIPSEGVNKTFHITITVPVGVKPGIHVFYIRAVGDGVYYGEQKVTIDVRSGDNVPPVTKLVVGSKWMCGNNYVATDTPFKLEAKDNWSDTGVKLTGYRIFNATYDSGWTDYTGPFNLSRLADGKYTIEFNSTDNAGNVEPRREYFNSRNVTLFSWTFVFEDSHGQGTTLKINTFYKFFHFVAPGRDFGIMKAQDMRQYDVRDGGLITTKIVLEYCDESLKMLARIDEDLGYCIFDAYDVDLCKTYYLFDRGHNPEYWLAKSPPELYRITEGCVRRFLKLIV